MVIREEVESCLLFLGLTSHTALSVSIIARRRGAQAALRPEYGCWCRVEQDVAV